MTKSVLYCNPSSHPEPGPEPCPETSNVILNLFQDQGSRFQNPVLNSTFLWHLDFEILN
jgi:hypothetical protein